MREAARGTSYWIYSVASVVASVIIIVFFAFVPVAKDFVVGLWCSALNYVEMPIVVVRNNFQALADFFLMRKNLNQKVAEMELQLFTMQETIEKNSLPISESGYDGYVIADVVARDHNDWWQEFKINKGSLDGITKHSAVVADGYLVGKIAEVYPHASRVVMVTSSEFTHVVTVADTRDLGIISGDGQGNIKLSYIPIDRTLQKGMKIYTSIMSSLVPPGIAIGKVFSVGEGKALYKDYNVAAGAHLTQLYTVAVIKQETKKNNSGNDE